MTRSDTPAPASPPVSIPRETALLALKLASPERGKVIAEYIDKVWADRQGQCIDAATGDMDNAALGRLAGRLVNDDRLASMVANAIDAARRSTFEDKARALGRGLRHALLTDDDATVDQYGLLLAALADLDMPHVRLLDEINRRTSGTATYAMPDAMIRDVMGQAYTDVTYLPVVLALSQRGLIMHPHQGFSEFAPSDETTWRVTPFGVAMMALLAEADTDLGSAP